MPITQHVTVFDTAGVTQQVQYQTSSTACTAQDAKQPGIQVVQ